MAAQSRWSPRLERLGPLGAVLLGLLATACESPHSAAPGTGQHQPPATTASAAPSAASTPAPTPAWRLPAVAHLLALGDLHGDLHAARAALALAGLTDSSGHWRGGTAVLVQTGDLLDRGDEERPLLAWLEQLQRQAHSAGGAVHLMLGNHELMNVAGDLRYVSSAGFAAFAELAPADSEAAKGPTLLRVPPNKRGRVVAFRPAGPFARKLAHFSVALVVGETVFVHGGLLPTYVRRGLDRLNREVAAWLWTGAPAGRALVSASDSPVWLRRFADHPDQQACAELHESLRLLHAARMVVGHTTVPTISSVCDGRLWRIDVGMSAYAGGKPEVLEITAKGVTPIRLEDGG